MQNTRELPGVAWAWRWGALGTATALAACASVSPLSGAKTLPAGTSEVAVAVEALLPAEDAEVGDNEVAFGLGPVVSYRRGLSDSVDASLRLYLIGISADVRYALAKGPFSASVGAQVGASSVGISINNSHDEYSVTSVELPLYLEYELSSSLSVMAVPRVGVARFTANGESESSVLALLALGLPFKLGRTGLIPSVSGGYYGNTMVVASALGFFF